MKLTSKTSRIERLKAVQEISDIDAFLFTSASTIKWLSGYFYNFESGPSPFQLLPAALLVVPGQYMCMILADNESFPEPASELNITLKLYSSYVHEIPLDFLNQFLNKLNEALQEYGITEAHLGIENDTLPFVVYTLCDALFRH